MKMFKHEDFIKEVKAGGRISVQIKCSEKTKSRRMKDETAFIETADKRVKEFEIR